MVGTYLFILVTRAPKGPNPWLGVGSWDFAAVTEIHFLHSVVVRVCKRHLDFLKETFLLASNKKATKQKHFIQIEMLLPKEPSDYIFLCQTFNLIRVSFLLVYCLLNLESRLQLSNVMIQLGQASSQSPTQKIDQNIAFSWDQTSLEFVMTIIVVVVHVLIDCVVENIFVIQHLLQR